MKSKKLIAAAVLSLSLFGCISASATTYLTANLSGTNSESSYVYLGAGTRDLNVTVNNGSTTAYAMRIIPWAPDEKVTDLTLDAPNSGSASFNAISYYKKGVVQSYYFRWQGHDSKSSGVCSFTD